LDNEVPKSYQKGVDYCQKALSLEPSARSPWISLNLLYTNKARHLESKQLSAIAIYKEALSMVEKGLITNPDDFQLRIYRVLPLLKLAEQAIKNQQDPKEYFNQALESVNEAIKINPEFAESWFQLADIQKQYGDYFRDVKVDLQKAESFYNQAISSYRQRNQLEYSLFSVIEIGDVLYDLAQVSLLNNQPLIALEQLQQSITTSAGVIPKRSKYFNEFNGLLQVYLEFVTLQKVNGIDAEESIKKTIQLMQETCALKGLALKHKHKLNQIYATILKNKWLDSDQLSSCQ
jgi:tetratricopeptide (TPR) repeat protein